MTIMNSDYPNRDIKISVTLVSITKLDVVVRLFATSYWWRNQGGMTW